MTDEVTVDPAVLWAAAAATRTSADEADARLKSGEDVLMGCGPGWGPDGRIAFDAFVNRLSERRVSLAGDCEDLAAGLAGAAHEYEQTDAHAGQNIAASRLVTSSQLRL